MLQPPFSLYTGRHRLPSKDIGFFQAAVHLG
jgi:hypothetical protein